MPRQYKVTLLTILLCLVAIEVPADSWDEGNYKPYNTDVVLEKTNLPLLFIDTRDKAGAIPQSSIKITGWQCV